MAKAFYSLSYLDLQNEATHAIGGLPDPNAPLSRIISGAIEYLYNSFEWSWREAIATLDFQSGVAQIPLPADFSEMIDLVGFQARYTAVKAAEWRDIARVRVYGLPDQHIMLYHLGSGGQYQVQNPTLVPAAVGIQSAGTLGTGSYYLRYSWLGTTPNFGETAGSPEALVGLTGTQNTIQFTAPAAPANAGLANVYLGTNVNQEQFVGSVAGGGVLNITALPASTVPFWPQSNSTYDPSQVMGKVLEVAPIPSTAMVQALYLTYRRGAPVLVNPTDVPQVPYNFFDLLRTLVRAMAVSSTTQQAGHDWQLFNDQLPRYKAADTKSLGEPGGMIDCLNVDDGNYALRPWLAIKSPYEA